MEEDKYTKKLVIISFCLIFLILGAGITAGVLYHRKSLKNASLKPFTKRLTFKKLKNPEPSDSESLDLTDLTDDETIAEAIKNVIVKNISLLKEVYKTGFTNFFSKFKELMIQNDVSEDDINRMEELLSKADKVKEEELLSNE